MIDVIKTVVCFFAPDPLEVSPVDTAISEEQLVQTTNISNKSSSLEETALVCSVSRAMKQRATAQKTTSLRYNLSGTRKLTEVGALSAGFTTWQTEATW